MRTPSTVVHPHPGAPAQTVIPPSATPVRVSRRGVLRLGFFTALATMLAGAGASIVNSLYPRGLAGFGGPVAVPAWRIPKPGDPPVQNVEGHFLLVNLAPDEGRHAADEAPSAGGLLALWWKCPHLGCTVPWRGDFVSPHDDDQRRGDFLCPCHGSTYTKAGVRFFGPAPRSMDTMEVEVTKTGIMVQTGKRRNGAIDNPQRAIPYTPERLTS